MLKSDSLLAISVQPLGSHSAAADLSMVGCVSDTQANLTVSAAHVTSPNGPGRSSYDSGQSPAYWLAPVGASYSVAYALAAEYRAANDLD